ncbi:MAG: 16S rRNA (guanine(966)-N(2))-methyltransferase RsmD [Lachnospiraceae bacterium]|nr:16S rRNA (guanine(966)-N(2))-methyltransferase RsmD [Lachnospiraceae bacterium]
MRVIAGTKRRLNLKTVEGLNTRPTTDRIKETLFNIISDDIYDCRFLDIFAGSGQIGIEALSRGASVAYFIENNKKAFSVINENLDFTKLKGDAKVIKADFLSALSSLKGEKFDIIYADPPYAAGYEPDLLKSIIENDLLNEDGYVIIEADLKTDFNFISELGYDIIKEKNYKTNKHVFLRVR